MKNQTKLLKGILIDPYKREVREIQIEGSIHPWHTLLQCECVGVSHLAYNQLTNRETDLWYDDEFLYTKADAPTFRVRLQNGEQLTVYGYGLVLAGNVNNGETVSLNVRCPNAVETFARAFEVQFEKWERRINQKDVMNELLRTPELELSGSYKEGWNE
jgi:hypothetical protein